MIKINSNNVAIIILNWNGWKDTIACLDSLFPHIASNMQVIVCDNASTDGSVENIKAWASGANLKHVQPSFVIEKANLPIDFIEYSRTEAETRADRDNHPLVIIRTGGNLGFAGGNNVGLRYAMARGFDYFWLLNNDTVVNKSSLNELVKKIAGDPRIGMCGSTLVYYHKPNIIQAMGGAKYDWSTSIGSHLGVGNLVSDLESVEENSIEKEIQYVVGASMLVTRDFIETIGLMSEDYFLYFEEIDWAVRSRNNYKLSWAKNSIVWHKEGGSIGSSHHSRPSDTSLFYIYKNRIVFNKKYNRKLIYKIYYRVFFELLVYSKRKDWSAIKIIIKAILSTFRK